MRGRSRSAAASRGRRRCRGRARRSCIGSSAAQTFDYKGASATIAAEFDPIDEIINEGGNGNVCKETKSETEPNTATYTMTSPGFTMMGLPTITADVATTGANGALNLSALFSKRLSIAFAVSRRFLRPFITSNGPTSLKIPLGIISSS